MGSISFERLRLIVLSQKCIGLYTSRHNVKLWAQGTKINRTSQANTMKKVMGWKNAKKKYHISDSPKPSLPLQCSNHVQKKQPKRVSVLNKLFMKNITDVMTTQSIVDILGGKAFEITRVEVSPDYNNVNVFWHSAVEESEEIQNALAKEAPNIRHELSQLRLMGVVPKLSFIKDKKCSQMNEMDQLLSVADYGDYSSECINPDVEEVLEGKEPFPVMSHTVFGLDHSRIMEKIMQAKRKSMALHRTESRSGKNYNSSVNRLCKND